MSVERLNERLKQFGEAVSTLLGHLSSTSDEDPSGEAFESQLRRWSLAAFERFEAVGDFDDFWKRGNAMDACLVFASACRRRWPDDPDVIAMQASVTHMLEQSLAYFGRTDPGQLWADDFGWWGLLALNARSHLLAMDEPALAAEFWELATERCWAFELRTAYDHSPDAKPVPHGCRNGDANGSSAGVKNTVTNVLLFLLSLRIYRVARAEHLPGAQQYLEMAYRQWSWFDAWFRLEESGYLKRISPSAALVQERPMARFAGSDYQGVSHPPWSPGWVWSGDQGMLVAALTDLLAVSDDLGARASATRRASGFSKDDFVKDAFEVRVRHLIGLIGGGVKTALTGEADGLIHEAPCRGSFAPVHAGDYLAGRGVMVRYLCADEEKSLLGIDLDRNVRASARAIWATRDEATAQFGAEFTSARGDRLHARQYRTRCGQADRVRRWRLSSMDVRTRDGVCQAVGLDMLGAAIRSL